MIAALLFIAGLALIFVSLAGLRGLRLREGHDRANRVAGDAKVPLVLVPRAPPFRVKDATPKSELPTEQQASLRARSCDPHAPICQACNCRMWLESDDMVITATEAISQRQYECEECQTVATVVVRGRVYSYTVEVKQRTSRKKSFERFDTGRSQPEEQK